MDGIVFQTLDDRRVELERHRENSSRQAEAEGHFRTTGLGSMEFPTRVDFGVTFVKKPVVSYGAEIDLDELGELMNGLDAGVRDALNPDPDNGTPVLPLVSGFVTDWDEDARGFYTGAWCGVRVHYPVMNMPLGETSGLQEIVDLSVVVLHHFRFSAIGMKDVPTQLTD